MSYGSLEQPPAQIQPPPSTNPFLNNQIVEEQVQPESKDTYLHGTVQDRTY